jgi:hypothetical protein
MESIGFKEWSLVCDALGRGEQSVILRKGGVAEGRDRFSFRHREFFLFPTFFHEQIGKVRSGVGETAVSREEALILTFSHGEKGSLAVAREVGEIAITLFAKVEQAIRIASLKTAAALRPLHVLSDEVVTERFNYKGAGLNVAFVRVFRLDSPWILANEKRYVGCRSWVNLPATCDMEMHPVIDDLLHEKRHAEFARILGSS